MNPTAARDSMSLPAEQPRPTRLPTLGELEPELLATSRAQRRWALARPFMPMLCFVAAWHVGLWWLTPLVIFLLFVAVVTVTHDVVHESLGLTQAQTEWWLFVLGALLLESGHAYRTTHHQHHRVFPGPDDPEGNPARMSFWAAVFWGPLFLPRLWLWAYCRNRGRLDQRRWLLAEATWAIALPVAAVALWPVTRGLAAYAGLVIVGSWVYPLLTVHLPHYGYGDSPLTQTSTLRGILIPRLFLELTYHLEHHLYPAVPSHHLAKLSSRLDSALRANGVRPKRVP